jgi:carbonic anhydrase
MCQVCGIKSHFGMSRRGLLGGAVATFVSTRFAFAAPNAAGDGVPGDVALRELMAGNGRYLANQPTHRNVNAGRAERVATQKPIAAVLSCADSRVAPEYVFDQGPGQLFVVRVAGNVLNEDGAASLEYAVKFLGVRLVLVLGHANCGAVKAAIDVAQKGAALPGHLPGLIDLIKPAVVAAAATKPTDLLSAAIAENARTEARHIATEAPILSAAVTSGQLKVTSGVYDLATGRVNLV